MLQYHPQTSAMLRLPLKLEITELTAVCVDGGVARGRESGNDRDSRARWLGIYGDGRDGGVSWCRIDRGYDHGRVWLGTENGRDGEHGWSGVNRNNGRRIDRGGTDDHGDSARRKLIGGSLRIGVDILHLMIIVTLLHIRPGFLDPDLSPVFSSALPFSICTHLLPRIPGMGESDSPMERIAGVEIGFFLVKRNRLY